MKRALTLKWLPSDFTKIPVINQFDKKVRKHGKLFMELTDIRRQKTTRKVLFFKVIPKKDKMNANIMFSECLVFSKITKKQSYPGFEAVQAVGKRHSH